MFSSFFQIYLFIANFSFGIIAGSFYTFIYDIKLPVKLSFLRYVIDLIFLLIIVFFYFMYTTIFNFPNIRFYEVLALFLGAVYGFKTFYIPVAKFLKVLYNIKGKNKKSKEDALWKKGD